MVCLHWNWAHESLFVNEKNSDIPVSSLPEKQAKLTKILFSQAILIFDH